MRQADDTGIPDSVRWIVYAIERIGFPVFAAAAMFFLGYKSMTDMTSVLNRVTMTLVEFRAQVRADHQEMLDHVRRDEADRRRVHIQKE